MPSVYVRDVCGKKDTENNVTSFTLHASVDLVTEVRFGMTAVTCCSLGSPRTYTIVKQVFVYWMKNSPPAILYWILQFYWSCQEFFSFECIMSDCMAAAGGTDRLCDAEPNK